MAKTGESGFVENHIEKLVLGATALLMIGALLHWVVSSPRTVELKPGRLPVAQKAYAPDQVDQGLEEMSELLKTRIRDQKVSIEPVPPYLAILQKLRASPLDPRIDLYVDLGPASKSPDADAGDVGGPKLKLADLKALPKPEPVRLGANSEIQVVESLDDAGQAVYSFKELDVIHGVAVFDFGKMVATWRKSLDEAYIPPSLVFCAVEVQRRHRRPDGTWSKPEAVSLAMAPVAEPLPKMPAFDGKNLDEVRLAIGQLQQIHHQETILEPPYHRILWPGRQIGTWMIEGHKPRTRVSNLEDVPTASPSGPAHTGTVRRPPTPVRTGTGRHNVPPIGPDGNPITRDAQPRRAPPSRTRTGRHNVPPIGPDGNPITNRGARRPPPSGAGTGRHGVPPIGPDGRPTGQPRPKPRPTPKTPKPQPKPIPRPVPTATPAPDATATLMPTVVSVPGLSQQLAHAEGIVEIWFHDANVAKETPYAYRLRVVVLNPLFGRARAVEKPEDAAVVALTSPWSDWGPPATIRRPTEFFVVGRFPERQIAVVRVFTERWGQRVDHRFNVKRGEAIGRNEKKRLVHPDGTERLVDVDFNTGAIAVDLDFNRKQRIPNSKYARTTTELVYVDTKGRLQTRTQLRDLASERYRQLDKESPH